jgi:hypothetical protein
MTDLALTVQQTVSPTLVDENGNPVPTKLVPISSSNPGSDPTFVFRPGDPAGARQNIYTDPMLLDTALQQVAGPKWVEIDGTFALPTIPAGLSMHLNDVTLVPNNQNVAPLVFAVGAFIDPSTIQLRIAGGLVVFGSGAFVWTIPAGGIAPTLFIEEDSELSGNTPGSSFIHIPAGLTMAIHASSFGLIGDGVTSALDLAAGATATMNAAGGGGLAANGLSGAGAAGLTVRLYAGGINATPQAIEPVVVTPNTNSVTAKNVGALGPALTVTETTAALTRIASGIVEVSGTIAVTPAVGSGATVATFNLLRDAVVIASVTQGVNAAIPQTVSLAINDTLPNFAAHTYSVQAIGAVNLTVAIGAAFVNANERL